ncbi:MAG: pilin [Candidatus Saccharibacteria bacterium]|nr:pilin [Candidatus Saccharibacteria bacterium]
MKNINPNLFFKLSLIIILSIVNVTYFSGLASAIELYGQKVEEKIKSVSSGSYEEKMLVDNMVEMPVKYCKVILTTKENKKIELKTDERSNLCDDKVIKEVKKELIKAKLYKASKAEQDELKEKGKNTGSAGKSCGGTSTALIECDGNENGLVALIKMVVNILYAMVGVIAIIMIMAAGVVYATAGENANQINTAKTMIRNTVIGILLYVFMTIILNFLVPGGVFK